MRKIVNQDKIEVQEEKSRRRRKQNKTITKRIPQVMSKEPITIPSGQLDAQIAPKQKMVYLLKLPPLHFTAEHNVRWHRIDPWLV